MVTFSTLSSILPTTFKLNKTIAPVEQRNIKFAKFSGVFPHTSCGMLEYFMTYFAAGKNRLEISIRVYKCTFYVNM